MADLHGQHLDLWEIWTSNNGSHLHRINAKKLI